MPRTNTLIIGGGQAGLAMSRCLSDLAIDNVVLESGRVGERWRSERWESLRLLTPRWQSRLPGYRYEGTDPDGFMSRTEIIDYLDDYARSFGAPLEERTTVTAVKPHPWGYRVKTTHREWLARNVVVATGHSMRSRLPLMAKTLDGDLVQVVPTAYRNPADLPPGGVLVVGAAATGVQLAREIHASGRPVTLAVGAHTRVPRTYRGRDIMWWLDAVGALDEPVERRFGAEPPRPEPSLHLIGSPEHSPIDLGVLQAEGVRLTGRLIAAEGNMVHLAGDLAGSIAASEAKLGRLLEKIDHYVDTTRVPAGAPEGLAPVPVPPAPDRLNLVAEGIHSVLWATGYSRSYPWLHVPVFDRRGEIRHEGGATPEPGLYVIGLPFLRRRNSAFLDGVGRDAHALAAQIAVRETARKTTWYAVPEYGNRMAWAS